MMDIKYLKSTVASNKIELTPVPLISQIPACFRAVGSPLAPSDRAKTL